jgi:hypothetical protein
MRLKVSVQLEFAFSSMKPPKDFCQRYIVQKPPASTTRWLFAIAKGGEICYTMPGVITGGPPFMATLALLLRSQQVDCGKLSVRLLSATLSG